MSRTLTWRVAGETTPTAFKVERSSDGAVTYTTIATPARDAVYDRKLKLYEYVDSGGAAGHVYRVTPMVDATPGVAALAVSPPDPTPQCLVVGVIVDAQGNPAPNQVVRIDVAPLKKASRLAVAGAFGLRNSTVNAIPLPVRAYTDAHGQWSVLLAQGAVCRVMIAAASIVRYVHVPSGEGPVNLYDMEEVVGGNQYTSWPEPTGEPSYPRLLTARARRAIIGAQSPGAFPGLLRLEKTDESVSRYTSVPRVG